MDSPVSTTSFSSRDWFHIDSKCLYDPLFEPHMPKESASIQQGRITCPLRILAGLLLLPFLPVPTVHCHHCLARHQKCQRQLHKNEQSKQPRINGCNMDPPLQEWGAPGGSTLRVSWPVFKDGFENQIWGSQYPTSSVTPVVLQEILGIRKLPEILDLMHHDGNLSATPCLPDGSSALPPLSGWYHRARLR